MDPTIIYSGSIMFLFGITSAKWALELGYSQISQMAHFIAGLFLGPLVLLILYVRIIYKKKSENLPGSQLVGKLKSAS